MSKWIVECEDIRKIHRWDNDLKCYVPVIGKKAVEVKMEYDNEAGLSVIDENNVFHFEGQDKYYAVED